MSIAGSMTWEITWPLILASSSCSYAAAALARSLFRKGANLAAAIGPAHPALGTPYAFDLLAHSRPGLAR